MHSKTSWSMVLLKWLLLFFSWFKSLLSKLEFHPYSFERVMKSPRVIPSIKHVVPILSLIQLDRSHHYK